MENTFAFLAGHLLVIVTVIIVLHFLSRTPNLQRRIDQALEFADRPRQLRALQDLNQNALEEKAVLQANTRRLDEVRKGKAFSVNPAPLRAHYISGIIATIVFYLGDSGLLVKLGGPAHLFALDLLEWSALGGPIAAITLTICHWIIYSALSDSQRPALALRRAKLGAWISGVFSVVAIFAVYSGRTIDPTVYPWADTVVQVGMWILTIGFAIAGGFASAVAAIADEEASLEESLARNTARLDDYTRHLDIIDRRVKELDLASREIVVLPANDVATAAASVANGKDKERHRAAVGGE